MNEIRLWIHC